ncbi:MAG: RCKP-type rubredoxin-like domain-containing protein [Thermacetogeniaceae bacterium]
MDMAVWQCQDCGWEKETRCKPKKCANCGGTNIKKKEQ